MNTNGSENYLVIKNRMNFTDWLGHNMVVDCGFTTICTYPNAVWSPIINNGSPVRRLILGVCDGKNKNDIKNNEKKYLPKWLRDYEVNPSIGYTSSLGAYVEIIPNREIDISDDGIRWFHALGDSCKSNFGKIKIMLPVIDSCNLNG